MDIRLRHGTGKLEGELRLEASKSISNRALIIKALCEQPFHIENISKAEDSVVLQRLLQQKGNIYDCGAGGTTFRFLTAYLSILPGIKVITGTEGLQKRPVGELVRCLRAIGANIIYLKKEGFPPLQIGEPQLGESQSVVEIDASVSSQFVSALLMIAPELPGGLSLKMNNGIASEPYIEMTLRLMGYFGISVFRENDLISIAPQKYKARDIEIEADWSGASYYYAAAALSEYADIQLNGLQKNSLQGDSIISELGKQFGVETIFNNGGVRLIKEKSADLNHFEYDFVDHPDLAQTMAVLVAGKGITGLFSGIESLKIKETDRIAALKQELAKVGVYLSELPQRFSKAKTKKYYLIEGSVSQEEMVVETYDDHRMALSFFPLAMRQPVLIKSAEVVNKSYPNVWSDLKKLGFTIDFFN
jgi:3-phosphoshikimate 1-carboxyvinyltransferase